VNLSSDDEIRFTKDTHRLLADHVESELPSRGWAVADLPRGQRPLGNLEARYLPVDAEAWSSAIRTDWAGGVEWPGSGS